MGAIVGTRIGPRVATNAGNAGYGPSRYFTTAAEFTAQTGITASALYLGDEVSGDRIDLLGGTALAAVGAPRYQHPVGDAFGIEYSGGVFVGHRADVNAPGLNSFWCGAFFRVASVYGSLPGIAGRFNAGFTQGYGLYQQSSFLGTSALFRDGVSSLLLGSPFGYLVPDAAYFIQLQVDRAANMARYRCSPLSHGAVHAQEASIAGYGTFDVAGQTFGCGSFCAAVSGNNAVGRTGYAVGAQCEGSSKLAQIAAGLGVE